MAIAQPTHPYDDAAPQRAGLTPALVLAPYHPWRRSRKLKQFPAKILAFLLFVLVCLPARSQLVTADASPTPPPVLRGPVKSSAEVSQQDFDLKGQLTYIGQVKPPFRAAYTLPGFNSLSPSKEESHSFTATAYLGARLWSGAEAYINEEMVIGVPFSNLAGLAAVPNTELQKASGPTPLFYTPRAFVRQTWGLGGETQQADSGFNQLAGALHSRRLVLSAGKLSVMDIFDGNAYAHDGRKDFFNWVNVAGGAFDYAADVRGYSFGAAIEYYRDEWVFRAGRFVVPRRSNGLQLNYSIMNFHGDQAEIEHAHELAGLPGKARLLLFRNRELMGRFDDALSFAAQQGGTPDVANVRSPGTKRGFVLNLEQDVARDLGIFARLSRNDGQTEMFSYTEVERSIQLGASLSGERWGRYGDSFGVAWTVNGLSMAHRDYLAAGGTGFLIGDGKLAYRPETLSEIYYSVPLRKATWLTADWTHVANPAYNADRGPVNVFGARIHAEF
jgi:high affinity Mn2+ porin